MTCCFLDRRMAKIITSDSVRMTIIVMVMAISARTFFSAGTIFSDVLFYPSAIFLGMFIASIVSRIAPILPDFGVEGRVISSVILGKTQIGDQDHGYHGQRNQGVASVVTLLVFFVVLVFAITVV